MALSTQNLQGEEKKVTKSGKFTHYGCPIQLLILAVFVVHSLQLWCLFTVADAVWSCAPFRALFLWIHFVVVRGVGCIFTEMVSGAATFPGTKDAWDQLDRIWQVKRLVSEKNLTCIRIVLYL